MCALGYSFEAALADLIDNSLSAAANCVELHFPPYDQPYAAILDDGTDSRYRCAVRTHQKNYLRNIFAPVYLQARSVSQQIPVFGKKRPLQ
jgi:hypothetical protein